MKIAFVSPEIFPFAKTGGLADVSYSLPVALAGRGHDIRVIMPRYYSVDKNRFRLELIVPVLPVDTKIAAVYFTANIASLSAYFIDYGEFFGRDGLYGDVNGDFPDNAERFAFFARASLELLKKINFRADIIHCNDWQTGIIPLFLKTIYSGDKFFKNTAAVMTVHNAGYQGIFERERVRSSGLYGLDKYLNYIESDGKINFLKGGVKFSDVITTVSKRYSSEIQKKEYGHGLADVFSGRNDRLYGILNGVDDTQWNPSADIYLAEKYSLRNPAGKKSCKKDLQRRMGLPEVDDIPAVGILSRMTFQKGTDVLADAMEYLLEDDSLQFFIAGSGGDWIYRKYQHLKALFPDKVGLYTGYDEDIAHIIQAGLDIFILPSRYEPCGLSVMYSLKYGAVPVVRATGGLDDIVQEWDASLKMGNGFKFNTLVVEEIYNTLRGVLRIYRDRKEWRFIIKNAMNFSRTWDDAVTEYEKVYSRAENLLKKLPDKI